MPVPRHYSSKSIGPSSWTDISGHDTTKLLPVPRMRDRVHTHVNVKRGKIRRTNSTATGLFAPGDCFACINTGSILAVVVVDGLIQTVDHGRKPDRRHTRPSSADNSIWRQPGEHLASPGCRFFCIVLTLATLLCLSHRSALNPTPMSREAWHPSRP